MQIAITQPALSSNEISQNKADIAAALRKLELKSKREKQRRFLIPAGFLAVAIIINIVCQPFPWIGFTCSLRQIVMSALAVSSILAFLYFDDLEPIFFFLVVIPFLCLLILIKGDNSPFLVSQEIGISDIFTAFGSLVVVIVVVGLSYIFYYARLSLIDEDIESLKGKQKSIQGSPKEACLEIREWLSDATIADFHKFVLAKSRQFTVSEVEAMRNYWESREERQKETQLQNDIEAACKEVYFTPLITQG